MIFYFVFLNTEENPLVHEYPEVTPGALSSGGNPCQAKKAINIQKIRTRPVKTARKPNPLKMKS